MTGTLNAVMRYDGGDQGQYESSGVFSNTSTSGSRTWKGDNGNHGKVTIKFNATPSGTIESTGKGDPFSLMPPYITIYAWKRTDYDDK